MNKRSETPKHCRPFHSHSLTHSLSHSLTLCLCLSLCSCQVLFSCIQRESQFENLKRNFSLKRKQIQRELRARALDYPVMALKTLKMDRTSRAWPTKVSGLRCLDYSLAPCRRPRSQPRSRLRSRLLREDGEKQTTTTENKGTQIKAEKVAPTADTSFTVKSIVRGALPAN